MFSKAILTTALISAVSAHQNFVQFWVNDVTPGLNGGIRMPPNNSPVTDLTSKDMACNVPGTNAATVKTIDANAGDSIKVQWTTTSHPGPITHFLLPVKDAATAAGAGDGWFKIDETDYVGGKWANELMMANNMSHEFKLPVNLPSGEYLLRSEMLALHAAQTLGGGQFYMGCAQLKVKGTGSSTCRPTISIPGAYKADDANIYIPNYYNGYDPTNYKAPGGPVASCGGAGGSAPTVPSSAPQPSSAAPTATASASATPPAAVKTPVASASPVASATPIASAAPAPSTGNGGSSDALPATFTVKTFIAWLESKSSKTRRHARAF
ncbi:glycosyl hydrolase family 61-domain-containing protein [Phaeosphaeriaceae sp. PMI808]|nr:glycosyl hydrolase family 61-domain-containing protein [Phaeosphaeriaceae sp. PMI808]